MKRSIETQSDDNQPAWAPTKEQVAGSRIAEFARWLDEQNVAEFTDTNDFQEIHAWASRNPEEFWGSVAEFFGVRFHTPPSAVWESPQMPGTKWFPGATLNIAEHLLQSPHIDRDAIIMLREDGCETSISHGELRQQVESLAGCLRDLGVQKGDRVVAYLPNSIEGVVGFLATAWIGAIWAQAGLDLSARSAADRLAQLEPKVLIGGGGYFFKGLVVDRRNEVRALRDLLPSLTCTIAATTAGLALNQEADNVLLWDTALAENGPVDVVPVPFDHPLWVLFSSGTSGPPKGIMHGHGGALLEQLASPGFHLDLRAQDVFFWYTSPNWMMWNAQICGLLHGATILLYDGSPVEPSTDRMWEIIEKYRVTVFGTSPAFLKACERAGSRPGRDFDLRSMRIIGVTGSLLPASTNAWVRNYISPDVQLGSTSGGTDVVGIFVSSNPMIPVYDGEISGVALGISLEVWDYNGNPVPAGVAGEMVITRPMPSMPIGFWNDPDGEMYRAAYFAEFPGTWRQGDEITLTERGTVIIHGRSDAMLNRNGIRIGSAEIYDAVESLPEIKDSLVVGIEREDGGYWMPLFVVLEATTEASELVDRQIRERLRERTSPRHLPDEIIFVPALPHTKTGKKLEVPIKRLLAGRPAAGVVSLSAVDDVEALQWFIDFAVERESRLNENALEPTDNYSNWRTYLPQRISRVLAAALDAFSEKGYHGTSIRQLAEKAELSVPGIYHHYRSKQDILIDLMLVVIDELITRSNYALAEAGEEPRAQFDALVDSLLLFHMNRQKGAMVSTNELRSLTPENRSRYVSRRDEQQRMLDIVVTDGVESGDFNTPHPGDASRAIASLCVGVASWYRADGELPEEEFLNRYRSIARSIVGVN